MESKPQEKTMRAPLALAAAPPGLVAAEEDHEHHQHQAQGDAGEADPHAHHKAMAKSSTTALRSTARYEIPDLAMIDQHGETVSTADLFDTDRPVMVNFIFTTCTAICPMMTSIFQQVQTRLGGVDLAGSWVSPGGEVDLAVDGFEADLVLAPGSAIDVAGTWVNDTVATAERAPAFIDGGRVALRGTPGGAVRLADRIIAVSAGEIPSTC